MSQQKIDKRFTSSYYNFHQPDDPKNLHYFMSEEILVPRCNNSDTQRINMFANHLNQLVHLVEPEFPRVFTNFENQVGEYSVSFKRAKEDFTIIKKIYKNLYNYDLIVQYNESKEYDILHFRTAVNITEDYGYKIEDSIPEKKEGDVIRKNDFVYKSTNYDNDGNFAYGRNLRAVYTAYKGLTYEDGIVISKSAAEKLKSYKVEKTMMSVNGNDFMLNLYGTKDFYKSFPKVGDYIDSNILVGMRRRRNDTSLNEFQTEKMLEIDYLNDTLIYTGGGTVVDIDIFCNKSLEDMKRKTDAFSKELTIILEDQIRYYAELASELEKIIPVRVLTEKEQEEELEEFGHVCKHPIDRNQNPNKYTDEISYYWKLSHETIDEKISWRYDGKSFDNVKIQFTILKENPITEGCKLTGRYGNKGVVTCIEDDEKMPVTTDGVRAEIVLNALGVINRLNLSQIQEVYINSMSNRLVEKLIELREDNDRIGMEDEFFSYLKIMNKKQYDFLYLEYLSLNRTQKDEFWDDIIENGIYIHQNPFFENTTMEDFKQIFREKPYLTKQYTFVGMEKPMTMGEMYFIRLKHEASNKSSMRSTSLLNFRNLPSKSTLKKEKKILYSTTPIRLGEMEVTNLLIPKRGDLVERLLKSYSTSEGDRLNLISDLQTAKDPMKLDIKLIEDLSINRKILEKYLNVLELSLED